MKNITIPLEKNIHLFGGYEVLVHMIALSVGIFFDVVASFPRLPLFYASALGFCFLIGGSLLLFYTLRTLRTMQAKIKNDHSVDALFFQSGPYRYFPHPTHVGLTFLIIGFALFSQGYFIIFSTILAAIIVEIFIFPKMERQIVCVHGVCYEQYRRQVPHVALTKKNKD
jgi:protein-S-isoprenylcysteine O-methyltransferase Ste14